MKKRMNRPQHHGGAASWAWDEKPRRDATAAKRGSNAQRPRQIARWQLGREIDRLPVTTHAIVASSGSNAELITGPVTYLSSMKIQYRQYNKNLD